MVYTCMNNHHHSKLSLGQDKRLRKFVIISLTIFAIITTISFLFFTTCQNDKECSTDYIGVLNVIIIVSGAIGLTYCFLILKGFNNKIDKDIIENYKDILDESDKKKLFDDDKEKLI